MNISTKQGLTTFKARLEKAKANGADIGLYSNNNYWLDVVNGCIKEGLAIDEIDAEQMSKDIKRLARGLK